jgi:hypothetical protein
MNDVLMGLVGVRVKNRVYVPRLTAVRRPWLACRDVVWMVMVAGAENATK